jgi:hypothetical protein
MRIPFLLLLSAAFSPSFAQPDTVDISKFGLTPGSRVNAVPYVQKALTECKENPGSVLFFPEGRYDFWPQYCQERNYHESNTTDNNPRRCAILLEHLQGLTIDCGGSEFIFHDRMQPFTVDSCSNIVIRDVSIDWDIPLTAEAEIAGVDSNHIDLRINACEFPYIIEGGKLVFVGEGWKSPWWGTMEFDRETLTVAYKTGDWGCLGGGWNRYRAEELSPGLVRLNFRFKRLPAEGNYLVLRHSERDHSGIFIQGSRDIRIENLDMFHNAGLGILAQYSSNLTYRKVSVVPNPEKARILSGHDDGFHYSNCAGQITIDGCRFRSLMDDPVNVHGTSVRILQKVDDHTLLCKYMHEQSIGMVWARMGEEVGFIENESMVTVATGIVDAYRAIDPEQFRVRFRDPVPEGIEEGDALENLAWTPDVLVTGSRFESCRARGLLVSTPGKVVIENNVFESSGAAILIAGDANYWFETGGVHDVTIRDNHFTDFCLTSMYQFCQAVISIYPEIPKLDPKKPAFHRNIRIEHNRFDLFDYPVLFARSVDGLTFSDNRLSPSHRFQPWHPNHFAVTLEFCKNVIILDNEIEKGTLGRNIRTKGMKDPDLKMEQNQFIRQ